ncbi:MAG: hypothetical protein Q8P80_01865 [Candidatus Levybacteria bacterium]|nr:hypothetical protein [Candidatus Levybacteria bacterium]
MFGFIEQAYACSLSRGVKIPSYCKEIGTDCTCITSSGQTISINSWGNQNIFLNLFLAPPIGQIDLAFFIFNLLLAFYAGLLMNKFFLRKKLKGKPLIVKTLILILVFLFLSIFIRVLLITILLSPLLGLI